MGSSKADLQAIRTSREDVALIARRLREARMDFEVRYAQSQKED
jgi:hypothetical protein